MIKPFHVKLWCIDNTTFMQTLFNHPDEVFMGLCTKWVIDILAARESTHDYPNVIVGFK